MIHPKSVRNHREDNASMSREYYQAIDDQEVEHNFQRLSNIPLPEASPGHTLFVVLIVVLLIRARGFENIQAELQAAALFQQ